MKKLQLLICAVLIMQNLGAADIPKILQVSSSIIKIAGKNNPRVAQFADTVARGSQVAENAVHFVGQLSDLQKRAAVLTQRLKCLDSSGSATCSTIDIGCTNEQACIVRMLTAIADLLEPIMKDLLGQATTVGKTTKIEPGALLNLIQLMPEGKKRDEYQKRLTDFIASATDNITFIRAITFMIDPSLVDTDTTMSAALKESYKSEPISVETTSHTFEEDLKDFV